MKRRAGVPFYRDVLGFILEDPDGYTFAVGMQLS
jgi:hypothetical protein